MAHESHISAHDLWTVDEAAEYLRRSPRTLANWRHLGIGPSYIPSGPVVLYRRDDVLAWLAAQVTTPTGAAS